MNNPIHETLGTLELRIARLQSQLSVLSSQIKMSQAYPERHQTLRKAASKVQRHLKRLAKLKQTIQVQQMGQTSVS